MFKFVRVFRPPKNARWSCTVRATPEITVERMRCWLHMHARGVVYWDRIRLRDPPKRRSGVCHNVRQRHFKDEYWLMRFWFSRKVDAAVFRLFWLH